MRLRAFSTLAAASLLLLILAFAAISVSQESESLHTEQRVEAGLRQQEAAWSLVRDMVAEFRGHWRPEVEEWITFAQAQSWKAPVEFTDLSARINVNSVHTFLLGESRLKEVLRTTVDAFDEKRRHDGPFVDLDVVKDLFSEEATKEYLTTWSVINVNTVDESAAARLAELRTGQASVGESLRSLLRSARIDQKVWNSQTWQSQAIGLDPRLDGLFGAEPELNVNTAPEFLIEAVLTYPALKVPDPATKLALLLSGRKQRPWTPDALRQVLGVEPGSRVLQYLGTRSAFLRGTFPIEGRTFEFILHRDHLESTQPSVRVVWQGWLT